jgi:hypothetical protein
LALASFYRALRDLVLAQRFARHDLPSTSVVYAHPSDEEIYVKTKNVPCVRSARCFLA